MKRSEKDMVTERIVKLEISAAKDVTVLAAMFETLKRLEEKLDQVDHVVRGNGTPGLREKMAENTGKIGNLEKIMHEKGEDHRSILNAIYGAYGALGVGIVLAIVTHFWK